MKVLQPGQLPARGVKVLVHSNPGDGKTRLMTSLDYDHPRWQGKTVYVPFDIKELALGGVLPRYREHMLVAAPPWLLPVGEREGRPSDLDPYSWMIEVLDYDWAALHGARTLVLDTFTSWSEDVISAVTNSAAYGAKTIQSGSQTLKMRDKPHYGVTHNMCMNVVRKIKAHPLNIVVAFWSDYDQPESGEPGGIYGGPRTVNMSISRAIAGEFDDVVYLRTEYSDKGTKHFAHTSPYGFWNAKLHIAAELNPMPSRQLDPDPVTWWKEYNKHLDAAVSASEILANVAKMP